MHINTVVCGVFWYSALLKIGESRLLWVGFLIWVGALFHTRRCCTLCLRM